MAAIDKMYVNSYYEYDDLRRWAIAYYPQLNEINMEGEDMENFLKDFKKYMKE